jgi:type I restriction enzyme S subunit
MRKMRVSGIDWIGTIPQDWQLSKIGSLYTQRNEKVSDKDYQPLSVTMQGILPQLATAAKTNDGDNRKLVRVGDFAINSRSDRRGSCGISPLDGSVSLINIILTPRTAMHPGYYNWLFHTTLFADEFYKWGHGIVADLWTTRWQEMKSITVPVPEYAEQERIAAFLDAECAEIDAVLEKTRASIEEYKKLKQAVITQAVTKGIRGDRPMKDSGSVWFEEIPCNWVMKRIKYLFHIKKDIAGKEGYTVLSITQKGIQPKDLSKNEGQIAANYSQYQLLAPGDFAMNHMDLLTGWVDISKYSGVTSPDYRVFVLDDAEKNDSSYYLYLMQMCYFNRIFYGLGQGVSGMGRWRLQADKFLNFPVVVPPVDEQKEIVSYLNEKCKQLDTLIRNKQQYLTEIENYKKSLIYEYVTGKKEVV